MRQSMASDNREQILKDIDTLSLEKYVDEIVGSTLDGISRCKTEKDVWSAVEVSWIRTVFASYTETSVRLYLLCIDDFQQRSPHPLSPSYRKRSVCLLAPVCPVLVRNNVKKKMLQECPDNDPSFEYARNWPW